MCLLARYLAGKKCLIQRLAEKMAEVCGRGRRKYCRHWASLNEVVWWAKLWQCSVKRVGVCLRQPVQVPAQPVAQADGQRRCCSLVFALVGGAVARRLARTLGLPIHAKAQAPTSVCWLARQQVRRPGSLQPACFRRQGSR